MTGRTPYYKTRKGRAYFELGKARAEAAGMKSSYALGKAGRDTERAALSLYWEWQDRIGNPTPQKPNPHRRGSVAHWHHKFRTTERWKRKSLATIKEWDYCWPLINERFGNTLLNGVSPIDFERFYYTLETQKGEYARWRTVKIARALFKAAVDYDLINASPCLTLPNPMPKPRDAVWFAHEVATLVKTAQDAKYPAMALGIRLSWETLMSPSDVRKLTQAMLKRDNEGFYIKTTRSKTGKDVIVPISSGLSDDLIAYIDALDFDLMPDQPILRTVRDGRSYTKVRFTDEFARIRRMAFGEKETRKMMDLRRSGNVEADLGGASPDDRAEILANTLNKDAALEATYTPPTVAKARKLAKQRELGRAILDQESGNLQSVNKKRSEKS